MLIMKDNHQLYLNLDDERALKLILDFYLTEVSDNWNDSLNETSLITRIEDLINY